MNRKQTKLHNAIENLVYSYKIKTKDKTATQIGQEIKKQSVEDWREYNRLRKEYAQVWKDELRRFVHLNNNTHSIVDYNQFLDYCEKKGTEHPLPVGFDGYIGEDAKLYIFDEKGQKQEVFGRPSKHMFPSVVTNKHFDSVSCPWVFIAMREDGTQGNYFYTKAFKKEQRLKKFMNVSSLIQVIDKVRNKWIKLIHDFDRGNPKCVAAAVLELLYQFSARIGSAGNGTEEGKKTFGIATLRRKHYKQKKDCFVLPYLGKDAVKTKHTWPTENCEPDIAEDVMFIVDLLAIDKKPSDFLFTYRLKNGNERPIQPQTVNKLFKELGSGDCTVHKLRTYHATAMAQEELDKLKTKRKKFFNRKQAAEALMTIAKRVGRKLNHVRRTKEGRQSVTGSTALANYIDTSLQKMFYDFYKIPYPKYL